MAETMITGATATGVTGLTILSAQKVIDMADRIYLLQPEAAPLYVLVSKLNKRVAINTTIQWLEDDLNPSWSYIAATATSADTSLTVTTSEGVYFNKNDLVKNPVTGEIMLITASTTSAVTAVRGYGTTCAASAASGEWIVIIGPAFGEGSLTTDLVAKSTTTSQKTNYLQLFRKSIDVTKSLANTELYGGADRNNQRRKKGIELMRDMERSFVYGEPRLDLDTIDSSLAYGPRRTTGGIDYFIATNVTAVGGVLTEYDFESFLRTLFRFGSTERYLFCAPLIISVISQWAQGKLQMFPKDKTYGVQIAQYLSPHGTINLVKDVLLEYQNSASSTSYWGGYAYGVELENLAYRYLQNRDVTLETEIQNPGDDVYKDQYIAEIGLEFRLEKTMGALTGVTG